MASIFTNKKSSENLQIKYLESELAAMKAAYNTEHRLRMQSEAHAKILKNKLEKKPLIPGGDAEYGYECGNMYCCADIKESWDYCPYCGFEIDWRTWVDEPNEDDFVAHTAVSRPLKEIAAEIRQRQAV